MKVTTKKNPRRPVRAGQEIRKSEEKNDAATARAVREATK